MQLYSIRKHAIKLSYLRNVKKTKASYIFMVAQNIILDGNDSKHYYHLPDSKQNFSFWNFLLFFFFNALVLLNGTGIKIEQQKCFHYGSSYVLQTNVSKVF